VGGQLGLVVVPSQCPGHLPVLLGQLLRDLLQHIDDVREARLGSALLIHDGAMLAQPLYLTVQGEDHICPEIRLGANQTINLISHPARLATEGCRAVNSR
jgi:hypothetical protein